MSEKKEEEAILHPTHGRAQWPLTSEEEWCGERKVKERGDWPATCMITCVTCCYWKREGVSTEGEKLGSCRRYAPRFVTT